MIIIKTHYRQEENKDPSRTLQGKAERRAGLGPSEPLFYAYTLTFYSFKIRS